MSILMLQFSSATLILWCTSDAQQDHNFIRGIYTNQTTTIMYHITQYKDSYTEVRAVSTAATVKLPETSLNGLLPSSLFCVFTCFFPPVLSFLFVFSLHRHCLRLHRHTSGQHATVLAPYNTSADTLRLTLGCLSFTNLNHLLRDEKTTTRCLSFSNFVDEWDAASSRRIPPLCPRLMMSVVDRECWGGSIWLSDCESTNPPPSNPSVQNGARWGPMKDVIGSLCMAASPCRVGD